MAITDAEAQALKSVIDTSVRPALDSLEASLVGGMSPFIVAQKAIAFAQASINALAQIEFKAGD